MRDETPFSLSLVSKKMQRSSSKNALGIPEDDDGLDPTMSPDAPPVYQPEDVLIVAFGNQGNECPGMISEAKVCQVSIHKTSLAGRNFKI